MQNELTTDYLRGFKTGCKLTLKNAHELLKMMAENFESRLLELENMPELQNIGENNEK